MLALVCRAFTTLLPVSVCVVVMFATPAGLKPERLVSTLDGVAAMKPCAAVP